MKSNYRNVLLHTMHTENSYNGEVGDHFHVSPQRFEMKFRIEDP